MSHEQVMVVRIGRSAEARVQALQASAAACLRRYESATVGDDTEVVRYQQIQAEIEAIAYAEYLRQQVGELGDADLTATNIELIWPFAVGTTHTATEGPPRRRAAREPWRPSANLHQQVAKGDYKRRAVAERFERQMDRWLIEAADDLTDPEPVCPSDLANRVLSESLRRYIAQDGTTSRVDAPVVYKDGSVARPLPLRSLMMTDERPPSGQRVLRLTLMSVRHMKIDPHVDGAWLRNREVSVKRAYAATDELVYTQSRQQLVALSAHEPLVIELFQTGLEAANVGFYRALADHHLERTGLRVTVIPRYYEGRDDSPDDFAPGTIWRVAP
jgi:hypothetical protein